jgi:CO/xanthine dehydrogenase Mo-binding subunit
LKGPLAGEGDETVNLASFPYGCHMCEVEVDVATGEVALVRIVVIGRPS